MLVWIILVAPLAVVMALVAIIAGRFLRYRTTSKGILSERPSADIMPAQPQGRILIVGDSTMYSAGVKDPAYTIAALFGAHYPGASVETKAANGARCRDVTRQLAAGAAEHYDIIMIGIGGNDVVRLTGSAALRRQLRALLAAASAKAERVVICSSVNVGNVGFFPFPLTYLYDYRSRLFGQLCQQAADQWDNVQFVNFYRPLNDDHYGRRSRAKFVAADGFHASEYANEYFFKLIVASAGLRPPLRRDGHS